MMMLDLFRIEYTANSLEKYSRTFWIGLGVSVVTNLIQAFAMAFQRKSHIANDRRPIDQRISSFRRPLWLAGFLSYLAANIIGSVFSIGYLPIVILAPIGAMNLVFNAIAARLILGDPFTTKSVLGTLLIAIGALLVGLFGVIQEPNHSLEDLIQLYKKPAFIIYFSIMEAVIVSMMVITHLMEYRYHSMGGVGGKWLGCVIEPAKLKMTIGMSYGVLGGNISSQSMLFAKSGIELIIISLVSKNNQLQYALTWILLSMMILTAAMQLYYLNKGLRLCDTTILVPLSFCAFNVSCLFNGLVYYDQWDRLRWWQLLCVLVGVAITVGGVLLLTWRTGAANMQEETVVASLSPQDDDTERRASVDETTHLLARPSV
ncbi:uncharacterized protein BYT42DRAFT_564649 [Radiomyces spectabilis]|uniref:uncharacterized protein n=1 Tax=Radiomyces spectabilis TaxID=64574 RepID=UPI00221E7C93|nr:uncharacterized protein BYT42DRAFT_564649 [Radiomyces spectabilis]KAI8380907.1 hypothetical protein BYT42DRAFT_564649 [Radiomyces spectabilis]